MVWPGNNIQRHSHERSLLTSRPSYLLLLTSYLLPLTSYLQIRNSKFVIPMKWSTIKQVLQIVATIITTVLGTIAVQSCNL